MGCILKEGKYSPLPHRNPQAGLERIYASRNYGKAAAAREELLSLSIGNLFSSPLYSKILAKNPLFEAISLHGPTGPLIIRILIYLEVL
jgi:hypothetical protein